jgi:hypothetical protein
MQGHSFMMWEGEDGDRGGDCRPEEAIIMTVTAGRCHSGAC